MGRSEVRKKVVQALYELEFQPELVEQIIKGQSTSLPTDDSFFFEQLLQGIKQKQDDIDEKIRPLLKKGWTLERLSIVERSILRLAVYELRYEIETPKQVVINEAVELAKRFGDEESKRFINGILGELVRNWGKFDKMDQ